ncbi:MAG: hypothetical protein JOY58_06605 [Solirubrobacterales bacterium]|nr:hypothetical protein [Solirubrobacterales bacterium]MBV9047920.1 hypothetical protein [Solirubrobacterales bacterium]
MSFRSGLFRDRALHQGDVREALDERARIVGVPRWIALAIAALVILGFVAWSASTEIQTTVNAQGVISSNDGVPVVVSPVAGTVLTPPPPRGTVLRRGDVVATVNVGRGAPVEVRAATAGSVDLVLTAPGAFIPAGGELAIIVPVGATPVGFLFVTTSEASQLRLGMEALLSPRVPESRATALLEGRIVYIGNFPATPERLTLLLGPVLASQLAVGPPVDEVEVQLTPDRSTPSGYAWTAGAGPASVSVGTRVSARVRLKQQSPLSYVF